MLHSKAISFSYPNGTSFDFPDIDLQAGEQLLVTGASGIGKSTLLRLIAGFLPAAAGSLLVCDNELVGTSASKRDRLRAAHMGIVSQRPRAVQAISVMQNMMLVPYLTRTRVAAAEAEALLETLGIATHAKRKPAELSVGEQQRLAIAMATVHSPKLILADEPTSSLDRANCEAVLKMLRDQVERCNASLLIISHDDRLIPHFSDRLEL